jgi:hypothetical protein
MDYSIIAGGNRPALHSSEAFQNGIISLSAGTDPRVIAIRRDLRRNLRARYFSTAFFASLESSDRTPTYGKFR